ncbi:hypothetical protein F4808DRAFT_428408 [Astrocystis sublimbata]|nr:hypothetical protein F4808DRAFT_428408 [Astrocystis sublimbata]
MICPGLFSGSAGWLAGWLACVCAPLKKMPREISSGARVCDWGPTDASTTTTTTTQPSSPAFSLHLQQGHAGMWPPACGGVGCATYDSQRLGRQSSRPSKRPSGASFHDRERCAHHVGTRLRRRSDVAVCRGKDAPVITCPSNSICSNASWVKRFFDRRSRSSSHSRAVPRRVPFMIHPTDLQAVTTCFPHNSPRVVHRIASHHIVHHHC